MRILIVILIFISSLFALEIKTIDDRGYALKLHTMSWKTNWNKAIINYKELQSGGPNKDGIPAIDKPKFVTIKEAKTWLNDDEPLIFVHMHNQTKAYPLQVLIWHEIVNDTLANKPIVVTFCPLCNASIVFDRRVDNTVYDFGTSGLLRHSDLVMYDRQTESLWQQFTGQAIVGDKVTAQLTQVPSSILSLKTIYETYPNTLILSKETGHDREYGRNPYVGYDNINQSPFLFNGRTDDRLLPMQRVATVSINNKHKAYAFDRVKKEQVINDFFENKNLVVLFQNRVLSVLDRASIRASKDSGTVVIYDAKLNDEVLEFYYDKGFFDKQTKSEWNIFGEAIAGSLKGQKLKPIITGSHFWFAWAVFKPNTLLYK